MKRNTLFLSLVVLIGFCISQSCLAKQPIHTVNNHQSVVLDIQNMTCNMCKFTIKNALKNVKGVQSVEVNSDKNTAKISFDSQKTTIKALINTTTHAGYPATVQPKK